MNELQICLMQMLEDLNNLCMREEIEFFLVEGNALGAVRHGGFIPWDDDLDIGMTRENYNKLKNAILTDIDFQKRYFLQNNETDPDYPIPFSKIRKNNSLYIENGTKDIKMHQGIYIDIFILDYLSNNVIIRKLQSYSCQLFEMILRKNIPHNFIKRFISQIIFKLHIEKQSLKILQKFIENFNIKTDCYYSFFMCGDNCILDYNMIYPAKKLKYENESFFVFNYVEKYLEMRYGDYLKIPSQEEQKNNQHNISYTIELKKEEK